MALSGSDPAARPPVIGITTYFQDAAWGVWEGSAALVPGTYPAAVAAAGGIPVLLPPLGTDTRVLAGLDGLVVAGGSDVDPSFYRQDRHPLTVSQPERDRHELALTAAALEAGMPLLAVCRGAQILNVCLGGTLIQHLPDANPNADYRPAAGVFGKVSFTTAPHSLIESILGAGASAPCYHHQGIGELGRGLRVTAQDAEGTVEAIEAAAGGWVLGVQFHPEQNPADPRVFSAFAAAAAAFRSGDREARPNAEGARQ